MPYQRTWLVARYDSLVGKIIKACKFQNNRAAADLLGNLLHEIMPELPKETVVVPIPTIAPHVRVRGYDQTYLIARRLAKEQDIQLQRLLVRKNNTVQLGASHAQRDIQASKAFEVRQSINPNKIYLLVDDVVTTGATIKHAALALQSAGAVDIWVAALAKQSLN